MKKKTFELKTYHLQTPGMLSHPPIQVNDLADHIDDLKVQYSSDHSPGSGFIYGVGDCDDGSDDLW